MKMKRFQVLAAFLYISTSLIAAFFKKDDLAAARRTAVDLPLSCPCRSLHLSGGVFLAYYYYDLYIIVHYNVHTTTTYR